MNINDFKHYKNGIRVLKVDKFYYEDLFVINHTENELILMSNQH